VPPDLIDIGCNLTHRSFRHDRAQVLERAREAGVSSLVVTGTSLAESRAAAQLASDNQGALHATAGVHPHDARGCDEHTVPALADLAALPQVVAIGETGLDFNRNYSPPVDQERCFEQQLELASELGMPVFMHERDAHERFMEILRRYRGRLSGAVVHCFTGTAEELAAYLDLDLHIGITGWICDERRGSHLRELVQRIPAQRLMLETDSPFLLPRDLQPRPKDRRNEPAHLTHVANTVASCRDEPLETLAAAVTATSRRFFGFSASAQRSPVV
jgi:TatD DNase family protein